MSTEGLMSLMAALRSRAQAPAGGSPRSLRTGKELANRGGRMWKGASAESGGLGRHRRYLEELMFLASVDLFALVFAF